MRSIPHLVAILCLILGGCDLADQLGGLGGQSSGTHDAPDVQTEGLELRSSPDLDQLAAYYCPSVLGGFAGMGCAAMLGGSPDADELTFEVGVTLTLANPNDVPIPTLDLLVSLSLFEGGEDASLGTVCVSMCPGDAQDCDGSAKPGACEQGSGPLDSLMNGGDPQEAVAGLIAGVANGETLDELQEGAELLAGGAVTLDLVFALGVDEALAAIEHTASGWVDDIMQGNTPSLDIPVRLEGTAFFDMPAAGRFGVNFGPLDVSWSLATR